MSTNIAGTSLHIGDIVVIVIYFAFILTVGLWTSRKNRGTVGGYFLAGRNINWIPLGASLFASNVGSLHFVGLAGSGAESGIGISVYEINAIFVVLMLGWLFVPVYLTSGVFTTPEYLRERFGGERIRIYLAVLSLAMYIFTKISADLYAGAIFIEQSLKWNMYISIILLLSIAAIFTITGGLTAVIWTDFIQTIIMILGAFTLMILSFVRVGGYEMMVSRYKSAAPNATFSGNTTCGRPRADYMHLFRDPVSGDIPWPGIIGLTINSVWYWCADQVIVQRALAGKSYTHSKAGTVLAGYLKLLPMFLLVFPGMIARILFPDEIACVDPDVCEAVCQSRVGCSNAAYPMLVLRLLPPGIRGVLLAVMLSALMSSLTSIFNSSSTIFTMDIWRKVRTAATDMELMIVGRVSVLVLVVVSILWIPIIQASQGSQLFVYIQQVSTFLQPPICAVYLLAVFWGRTNEPGAFWGLMVGLVAGSIRFGLEFSFSIPSCISGLPDTRPGIIKHFHYLYFGICLFLLTGTVTICVSLLTEPINPKHLRRLTFWTRFSEEDREPLPGGQRDMGVPPGREQVPPGRERVPPGEKRVPPGGEQVPPGGERVPPGGERVPPGGERVSPGGEPVLPSGERVPPDSTEMERLHEFDRVEDFKITEHRVPCWRAAFNWVCGIETQTPTEQTPEEERKHREEMNSIRENPKWKAICNANAILLMVLASFLWGFYA